MKKNLSAKRGVRTKYFSNRKTNIFTAETHARISGVIRAAWGSIFSKQEKKLL